MKQILLIDNYDSFTYNLLHSLEKNEDVAVTVVRNDHLLNLPIDAFDKIVLSPCPGLPEEAGELLPFIKKNYSTKPFLGICLGHQALGHFFGAKLIKLNQVLHGVQLETRITKQTGISQITETSAGVASPTISILLAITSKLNRQANLFSSIQ